MLLEALKVCGHAPPPSPFAISGRDPVEASAAAAKLAAAAAEGAWGAVAVVDAAAGGAGDVAAGTQVAVARRRLPLPSPAGAVGGPALSPPTRPAQKRSSLESLRAMLAETRAELAVALERAERAEEELRRRSSFGGGGGGGRKRTLAECGGGEESGGPPRREHPPTPCVAVGGGVAGTPASGSRLM